MHIAIATPEYPPHSGGGILKFYRVLTPEYVKAGHRVTVLVANPFSDDFPPYEHDGVVVRSVSLASAQQAAARLAHLSATPTLRAWLGGASALADACLACAPDCIEAADLGLAFAPLVARGVDRPVIVQMHGSLGQISEREPARARDELDLALARVLEATLLPHAVEIQAYSPSNAAEWTDRLRRPVTMIPPATEVARRGGQPGNTALVVGRIQPWKGAELLCQALVQLGAGSSITIEWVGRDTSTAPGGGSFSSYLRSAYPAVWGKTVRPVGQKPFDEVRAMQAAARFVIVPSTWDTFNFTVVEAMAAGRVVVCSDGVGASFLVRHRDNGLVFSSGDPASLAAAIEQAAALSPAEASAVGREAHRTIDEELRPSTIAERRIGRMTRIVDASAESSDARPAAQVVPDWISGFLEPSAGRVASSAFLENVGMRDLAAHLAGRLRARVFAQREASR